MTLISIHALREEGDPFSAVRFWLQKVFLSTPSARRATNTDSVCKRKLFISIHALREEGDADHPAHPHRQPISIHALREEGDVDLPAPERRSAQFLSTPSARRATQEQHLER